MPREISLRWSIAPAIAPTWSFAPSRNIWRQPESGCAGWFNFATVCATPGRVMVLDSWQIVEVGGKRDTAANSHCRLDARWLDQMGTQARRSIEQGVDTVIVNRFGPLEAAGRGFRDVILAASETQTPLIVA